MKKIITFIIILLHSNYISSQTNLKKCNTTFLVNNEIDNNTDYAKARDLTLDFDFCYMENDLVAILDSNSKVGDFESKIKSNVSEFVKPNLSIAFIVRECLPSSKLLISRPVEFSWIKFPSNV